MDLEQKVDLLIDRQSEMREKLATIHQRVEDGWHTTLTCELRKRVMALENWRWYVMGTIAMLLFIFPIILNNVSGHIAAISTKLNELSNIIAGLRK